MTFVILSALGYREHPAAAMKLAEQAMCKRGAFVSLITEADISQSGQDTLSYGTQDRFTLVPLDLNHEQIDGYSRSVDATDRKLFIDGSGSTLMTIEDALKQLGTAALDRQSLRSFAISVDDHQLIGAAQLVQKLLFIEPLSLQICSPRKVARHIVLRGIIMRFVTLHLMWRLLSKAARGVGLR